MNELSVFKNEEFGEIRTVIIENEPMFCLSDVCKALGLTQPSKVKERLNEKGVSSIPTLTAGGEQKLLYINESNLYKTIFQSRISREIYRLGNIRSPPMHPKERNLRNR